MARQKKPLDAVQFTRESSERIARVVRAAETSLPGGKPLSFEQRPFEQASPVIRVCSWTGHWYAGGTLGIVRLVNVPGMPTAWARNYFFDMPSYSTNTNTPTYGVVGKERNVWILLNVEHGPHYSLSHVELTPSDLKFSRRQILTIGRTHSDANIQLTSCATKASGAQLSTFLG